MKASGLDFEKALAELEDIVSKLESGDLPLNESLLHFEKGVMLARYLRGELDRAEKKVEILLKDEEGGLKASPFSLEDEEGGAGDEDEEDEEESGPGDSEDDDKLPF